MNRTGWAVCVAALCFLAGAPKAGAQEPKRIKVVFECQCDDDVGRLYATAFRDLLASSPRFVEATNSAEVDSNGAIIDFNWKVVVVSIDPSDNKRGDRTAMSVVFLRGNSTFVTSLVQTAGRLRVEDAARSALSHLDSEVHAWNAK